MKIDIVGYNELTDVVELDIDDAGREYLLTLGLNALLLQALEALKEKEGQGE